MADIVQPQQSLLDTEYYGLYPIRPASLTRAFLNILRNYFTKPNLLRTERFRKKYNQGVTIEQQTNVLIVTPFAWRPDIADQRPAIVVRRLEWRPHRMGLSDGQIRYKEHKPFAEFIVGYSGSHVILCHSRESGEVDMLVEEVMNCFLWLGPFIRRALRLASFSAPLIDKVAMHTVNRDYFVCPVVLKYEWTEGWVYDKGTDELEDIVSLAIQDKPEVET